MGNSITTWKIIRALMMGYLSGCALAASPSVLTGDLSIFITSFLAAFLVAPIQCGIFGLFYLVFAITTLSILIPYGIRKSKPRLVFWSSFALTFIFGAIAGWTAITVTFIC